MFYGFYVIYSDLPDEQLEVELQKRTPTVRRLRTVNKNLRVYYLAAPFYINAKKEGLFENNAKPFQAVAYRINSSDFPRGELTSNFCIFPRDNTLKNREVREKIESIMGELQSIRLLSEGDYNIVRPSNTSNLDDIASGPCFVVFDRSVPLKTIVACRMIISSLYWGDQPINCVWARPSNPKKKSDLQIPRSDVQVRDV